MDKTYVLDLVCRIRVPDTEVANAAASELETVLRDVNGYAIMLELAADSSNSSQQYVVVSLICGITTKLWCEVDLPTKQNIIGRLWQLYVSVTNVELMERVAALLRDFVARSDTFGVLLTEVQRLEGYHAVFIWHIILKNSSGRDEWIAPACGSAAACIQTSAGLPLPRKLQIYARCMKIIRKMWQVFGVQELILILNTFCNEGIEQILEVRCLRKFWREMWLIRDEQLACLSGEQRVGLMMAWNNRFLRTCTSGFGALQLSPDQSIVPLIALNTQWPVARCEIPHDVLLWCELCVYRRELAEFNLVSEPRSNIFKLIVRNNDPNTVFEMIVSMMTRVPLGDNYWCGTMIVLWRMAVRRIPHVVVARVSEVLAAVSACMVAETNVIERPLLYLISDIASIQGLRVYLPVFRDFLVNGIARADGGEDHYEFLCSLRAYAHQCQDIDVLHALWERRAVFIPNNADRFAAVIDAFVVSGTEIGTALFEAITGFAFELVASACSSWILGGFLLLVCLCGRDHSLTERVFVLLRELFDDVFIRRTKCEMCAVACVILGFVRDQTGDMSKTLLAPYISVILQTIRDGGFSNDNMYCMIRVLSPYVSMFEPGDIRVCVDTCLRAVDVIERDSCSSATTVVAPLIQLCGAICYVFDADQMLRLFTFVSRYAMRPLNSCQPRGADGIAKDTLMTMFRRAVETGNMAVLQAGVSFLDIISGSCENDTALMKYYWEYVAEFASVETPAQGQIKSLCLSKIQDMEYCGLYQCWDAVCGLFENNVLTGDEVEGIATLAADLIMSTSEIGVKHMTAYFLTRCVRVGMERVFGILRRPGFLTSVQDVCRIMSHGIARDNVASLLLHIHLNLDDMYNAEIVGFLMTEYFPMLNDAEETESCAIMLFGGNDPRIDSLPVPVFVSLGKFFSAKRSFRALCEIPEDVLTKMEDRFLQLFESDSVFSSFTELQTLRNSLKMDVGASAILGKALERRAMDVG